MTLPVRLHPEALLELMDASSFYGTRLSDELQKAAELIGAMPMAWPLWPGSSKVRRRVLTRWPYAIVYTTKADEILIVAIEHTKRRPGYWLDRL